MLRLSTWSPFPPMFQLRRDLDDLFGRFAGQFPGEGQTPQAGAAWTPAVEGAVEDGTYVIRVALPGVDPKDVDISIADDTLTIKGQRRLASETKKEQYFARELAYGAFERSFTLPEGVDAGKISAKYVNGMLEVRVPAPVAVMPRKVTIAVEGSDPKSIKAA